MTAPPYAYTLLSRDGFEIRDIFPKSSATILRLWPWLMHIFLLSLSITIAVFGYNPRPSACLQLNGVFYRKIQGIVNFELDILLDGQPQEYPVRFNGAFDRSSPFKGPPSPAVNQAWDSILPRMPIKRWTKPIS